MDDDLKVIFKVSGEGEEDGGWRDGDATIGRRGEGGERMEEGEKRKDGEEGRAMVYCTHFLNREK